MVVKQYHPAFTVSIFQNTITMKYAFLIIVLLALVTSCSKQDDSQVTVTAVTNADSIRIADSIRQHTPITSSYVGRLAVSADYQGFTTRKFYQITDTVKDTAYVTLWPDSTIAVTYTELQLDDNGGSGYKTGRLSFTSRLNAAGHFQEKGDTKPSGQLGADRQTFSSYRQQIPTCGDIFQCNFSGQKL